MTSSHQPPTPFAMLPHALAHLRSRAGWKQEDLARSASVTVAQISRYERGEARPALETLEKLMAGLAIGRHDLVAALEEVERSAREREPSAEPPEGAELEALREIDRGLERTRRGFRNYLSILARRSEGGSAGPEG